MRIKFSIAQYGVLMPIFQKLAMTGRMSLDSFSDDDLIVLAEAVPRELPMGNTNQHRTRMSIMLKISDEREKRAMKGAD